LTTTGYKVLSIDDSNIPELLRYATDTYTTDCYGLMVIVMMLFLGLIFLAVSVGWTILLNVLWMIALFIVGFSHFLVTTENVFFRYDGISPETIE
jgi:hypothetical protein